MSPQCSELKRLPAKMLAFNPPVLIICVYCNSLINKEYELKYSIPSRCCLSLLLAFTTLP